MNNIDEKTARPHPYLLEIVITLKSGQERNKFRSLLSSLVKEDPHAQVLTGPNGQLILCGTDEYQLYSLIGGAVRASKITPDLGAPKVTYYETITKVYKIDHTHKSKASGPKGIVRIKLALEPLSSGAGFEFKSEVAADRVSKKYLSDIEWGIKGALVDGVVFGLPVIDLRVRLIDIDNHETNLKASLDAARTAVKEGLAAAAPTLLEPFMMVEVTTQKEYAGIISDDLKSRRGRIDQQARYDDTEMIRAVVPLANLFGYSNSLKSLSQQQATYTIQFDHFAPVSVPKDEPPRRPAVIMRS